MNATTRPSSAKTFLLFFGCLFAILLIFFARSFESNLIVFSNDGPLGINAADASKLPGGFKAWWFDLNWAGYQIPSATPNFSGLLRWILGPLYYAKFYPLASLLMLGACAWLFFRVLRFHPVICAIGGIAAALNGNVFSNMAWGQGSRPLALAAAFLALAALHSSRFGNSWIKIILAGLAVGWGVSEGFDVGALFSIFIAIFALFFSFVTEKTTAQKVSKGFARVALVAIFAGLLAAQTVTSLVTTQIRDRGGIGPATLSPEEHWRFITDLSTPPVETLGVVVPGVFGYATTTPGEKFYWGQQSRYNGSGEYAGIFVALVALAAVAFTLRKDGALSREQRLFVWFWTAAALVCLLFAFGKYTPLYKLIYPLPFFSTMRNPMKFMHVFHLCLLVLFGIGLQTIYELYLKNGSRKATALKAHLGKWWSSAPSFERRLTGSLLALLAIGLLGWLIYSSSRKDIIAAVQAIGVDPARAALVAQFSISSVGWFVLFLSLSTGLIILALSGWFSGAKARFALILMGLILTADLVRANYPWFIFWDYKVKYATNPIIDILRQKPYEKRADIVPFQVEQMQWLSQLFGIEWAQHHFFYYNIQSSHVVQDPRPLPDDAAYRKAFAGGANEQEQLALMMRKWELMSTRYLLWLAGQGVDLLNQRIPGANGRFQSHTRFELAPRADLKPGADITLTDLTAVVRPDGRYALVEFTGALPKAKLFSSWQVISNDAEVLKMLTSAEFSPANTVVLQEDPGLKAGGSNAAPGEVEFRSYEPKKVELAANVTSPAVLLLNDKFHADWKVWVDGQPARVIRANHIMRGVPLEPGKHTIVFEFVPPHGTLYVTIAALVLGIGLCGFLVATRQRNAAADADVAAA